MEEKGEQMENTTLARQEGENEFEHHRRIIEGKLTDKTLSDFDYTELSRYAYGKEYSADCARRMFYGSKRTLDLLEKHKISNVEDIDVLSDIDKKLIEFKKEQQKFRDQRNAFNKVIRERSRQEELNDILLDAIRNGDLPRLEYTPEPITKSNNDILVSLNDIHYGLCVKNAWNAYSPDICRKRMREYLGRVLEIAELHHSENCIVYNCGDSISGNIHLTIQIANKENVINQVKGVSELIAEFLAELSSHFNTVRYVSVAGNHSRIAAKDDAPSDERMDDLIEWYLEARLSEFKNIVIDTDSRLDPTMFVTSVRGKIYCGVHGDFDGSQTKISAIQTMVREPVYAILSGHMHHNTCDEVQGVKTVMAGSFLGMDDFCVKRRIYGHPEQMVCICDTSGIVCHYDVSLT
nr:MAG TPA: DNA polymerase II small subunit [Caudoviricetes sp.]